MNNIIYQNAQFKLYYLLIAIDGIITNEEKREFIGIVSKICGYTLSYAEALYNATEKFKDRINYDLQIKTLKDADDELKNQTIQNLRALALSDSTYQKEEGDFINKVISDLK